MNSNFKILSEKEENNRMNSYRKERKTPAPDIGSRVQNNVVKMFLFMATIQPGRRSWRLCLPQGPDSKGNLAVPIHLPHCEGLWAGPAPAETIPRDHRHNPDRQSNPRPHDPESTRCSLAQPALLSTCATRNIDMEMIMIRFSGPSTRKNAENIKCKM